MNRAVYLAGFGYIGVCLALVYKHRHPEAVMLPQAVVQATGSEAQQWFARVKPGCNAVEAVLQLQQNPAPKSTEGAGYTAACYALAGRIDKARATIAALDGRAQYEAAGIVFEVGHPIADAGDDASAGPIMELVVDYWPNHYMALYHAAMAEYGLGQNERVRTHLREFLKLYDQNDGWRSNAQEVLKKLDGAAGAQ